MNPYERYYLRRKILTGAIAVGAVALIGGGLLLWQPWNAKPKDDDVPDPPPVEDTNPVEDEIKPDLTITVGGKKVDCRLYQGDGWTIPVPMDWSIEEGDGEVSFLPPNGSTDSTCLVVRVSDQAEYDGTFISANAVEIGGAVGFERLFYTGTAGRGIGVFCRLAEGDMTEYEKMMTAMARTFTVGSERPFASLYPMASEPEWQEVDGEVVLFLDKDGIEVDTAARKATESRMNGWSNETKSNFTGKYRFGEPVWVSSYTCVTEDYIDVFMLPVEYQIASGKAESIVLGEGQAVNGGWLSDPNTVLYVVVYHDGSAVTGTDTVWNKPGYRGAKFVGNVLDRG